MKSKTVFFFPLAACLLLLAAACTKVAQPYPSLLQLRVEGVAASETKTSYDSEGAVGEFLWDTGDKIAVHYSTGSYENKEVSTAASTYGTVNAPSTASKKRNCYAVYPAEAAVAGNYGNPTLQVKLRSSYDIKSIVDGSSALTADYSPCPMVADNDPQSDYLDFYHVGGLLRVTVTVVPDGTSKLRVSLDKDITGTYNVASPGTTEPLIATKNTASNNAVTFTVAGTAGVSASVTDPIVLNVPIPTGVYGKVTVEALSSADAVLTTISLERQFTFRRHYGKRLFLQKGSDKPIELVEDLYLEGEDLTWQDNLNEGEDLTWEGDVLNWGEGLIWK